jgi:hypothetical protein
MVDLAIFREDGLIRIREFKREIAKGLKKTDLVE